MYTQDRPTEGSQQEIGTQRVRHASGRQERPPPNDITGIVITTKTSRQKTISSITLRRFATIRSYFLSSNHNSKNRTVCRLTVPILLFTVCALYAGTLVANRTTAPTYTPAFRSNTVLVAIWFFLFVSLTIATRCYASSLPSTTTPPIVPKLPTNAKHYQQTNRKLLSPINDSTINTSSSKVVLSRFIQSSSSSSSPSDISLNVTNSKRILRSRRRKRSYLPTGESSINFLNGNIVTSDEKAEEAHRTNYSSSSGVGVGPSSNSAVNGTKVKDTLKADVNFTTLLAAANPESRRPEISTRRPMQPAHVSDSSLRNTSVLVLVVTAVVLTIALGLVTCVLNHYRGGTAANPHDAARTPTSAPMLSVVSAGAAVGVGGMDRRCSRGTRELAAARDRQVRMQSVRTDMAKNLPPMIPMPDGEEHPCHSRLHLRDPEQEAEIYQRCVKPPPNRTVLESDSPPPYRSSSAGLLGSSSGSSSSGSDWSSSTCNTTTPYVIRCHSMSSTTSSSSGTKRTDHHNMSAATGQKTDFLQRTVKRFTGKKSTTTQHPQQSAQHDVVPVVIVPRQTSSNSTSSSSSSSSRPKPSV